MKRRNPAFIILIFLFWYYSTIRERKKPLLQDIFHKVRVTNLTQGGQSTMILPKYRKAVSVRTVASLRLRYPAALKWAIFFSSETSTPNP